MEVASLGEELPLLEGIRTTRAIRRLRPDPVPLALVKKGCEAGTFAPSAATASPGSSSRCSTRSAAAGSPSEGDGPFR